MSEVDAWIPTLCWTLLALCVTATWAAYCFAGRRFHSHPEWLLALGLTFMVAAVVLYSYAVPGTEGPIDVSIAALGGNLAASAFQLRAAREHRRWQHGLHHEIERKVAAIERIEPQLDALNRNDPRIVDLIDRLVEREHKLDQLREQLRRIDPD